MQLNHRRFLIHHYLIVLALSTESSAVLMWQFPGGSVSHYVIEYVLAQDSEGFASSNVTTKRTVNESQTSTFSYHKSFSWGRLQI